MNRVEKYMNIALAEAKKALKINEVPVGAVVVRHDQVIAKAYNLRETQKSPLAHAEILAIEKAAKALNTWRLEDCELYVTLEPCPMCAGAIIQSRIPNVYYGALDYKNGAHMSKVNLFSIDFTHHVDIIGGILEEPSKKLLKDFFKALRM